MFPSIKKSAESSSDPAKIKFLIEEASRLGQALIEGNNQTVKTRLATLTHEERSILRGVPKLMKLAEECGYLEMAANHLRLPPPGKLSVNVSIGAIINDNVSFKTSSTLPAIKQTRTKKPAKSSDPTPRPSPRVEVAATEPAASEIVEVAPETATFAMASLMPSEPTPRPSSAATTIIDEHLNPSSKPPSPREEVVITEPPSSPEAREVTPIVAAFTEEVSPPIPPKPTISARPQPTEREREIIKLRQTETLTLPRIPGDLELHHMARYGLDQLLISKLVDIEELRAKDQIKLRNGSGQTLLHLAASSKNLVIADLFLTGTYQPGKIVGNPNGFVNIVDEEQKSALHIAVEKGHIEMAQLLIDNGAKLLPGMAEFNLANPEMRDFIMSQTSALNPSTGTVSPSSTTGLRAAPDPLYKSPSTILTP